MTRKSASLLTKTQRRRIRNQFADLDEEKRRRDQRRVRERIESGVLDFQLLADYPDEQLSMAVDSTDDEELQDALADAYLTVERLRELRGIDREELISTARTCSEEVTADGTHTDVESLHRLDLRTETETERETAAEVSDRLQMDRWVKRANAAMGIGGVAIGISTLFWLSDQLLGTKLWRGGFDEVQQILFLLIFVGVVGWSLIMGYHLLMNVTIPSFRSRLRDSGESV
ncbi:hypothetical protein A4G99_19900 [Haladaptatus sp. R4]|uniref:hypothetical protein n=1 Tax=Haladaptatus sp. R4 TaxID=1679489 RepID=UPI0007B4B79B|nr:hypothetical protein [Haladaptatus sp. R4]KZN22473.1 hypothetical protein A4G99_19900 [Haladaptatus sp. R4]